MLPVPGDDPFGLGDDHSNHNNSSLKPKESLVFSGCSVRPCFILERKSCVIPAGRTLPYIKNL